MYVIERNEICEASIDHTHIYLSNGKYHLILLDIFDIFEA